MVVFGPPPTQVDIEFPVLESCFVTRHQTANEICHDSQSRMKVSAPEDTKPGVASPVYDQRRGHEVMLSRKGNY